MTIDPDAPEDEDFALLEEVEEELVLPVWEPTGEPRVDSALDLLMASACTVLGRSEFTTSTTTR